MTIRIGLLGASKISRGAILGPAAELEGVCVSRVAARDTERARAFAREHDIADIEADYAALCSSDAVDLVYNGLPPSAHAEWTVRALEAGKHVLCEKPFAMNAGEVEAMLAAEQASDGFLMEAFHHRYHPLWQRIVELIEAGAIGALREIDARFSGPIPFSPGELRYVPSLGGGAMMDLGCYPVHWSRTACGTEPRVAWASADWHASGVDVAMQARLEFPGGVSASVSCSMDEHTIEKFEATLSLTGTEGRIDVVNPLAPHDGHSLTVETTDDKHSEQVPGKSTYFHQLEWMLDVIAGKKTPLTGGSDGLATMQVIDALYEAARAG